MIPQLNGIPTAPPRIPTTAPVITPPVDQQRGRPPDEVVLSPEATNSLPIAPQAGDGRYGVAQSFLVTHAPGLFGTANEDVSSHSGQVDVAHHPGGVNIAATVNDQRGRSFGVNVSVDQIAHTMTIDGKSYEAKQIGAGNSVTYVYGSPDQPDQGTMTVSQDGDCHTLDFTPPVQVSAQHDQNVSASLHNIQYRDGGQ